ncbi:hypothetical protein DM02DRAFT_661056 [Periconia macrospinosa]|uniref:Uncharacterized protein n=1 Tax=Periconia macrospinosa TaxID=97972 RepID=A0A2V1D8Q0_9PLEO|nr:hypothetical protein DM02DRAFT_661056 [Periconia macrospinosa]
MELYNDKIKHMVNLQQEQSIEDCVEKECTVETPSIEDRVSGEYMVKECVEECATDQSLVEEPLTPEASTEGFPVAEETALTSECAAEPEDAVKGDDSCEICPFRATHLLGQEWESCSKCRAMVRQVTIQIASTVNLDDSGYEKFDQMLGY